MTLWNRTRGFLKKVGPGFITGAADDDPSGIATYTQTGAQFGYGQLWTAVAMLPFMVAIQEACARIGAVTGKGLARVIKENYGKKVAYAAVTLVLVANTINIGADIGAMAAASARALEPLVRTFPNAGEIAKLVFATGIVGLGLLGVSVLSGSASYALTEALNWKEGLNLKFKQAHGFYGVIIAATVIGLLLDFIGVDPIKALVFAAVLNGVAAVPLIFIIALTARSRPIMGEYRSGPLSHVFVWLTFAVMAASAVMMFVTLFLTR